MKYKLIKRSNPQDKIKQKWYALPVNEDRITKTDIPKEIVNISSLSCGDVFNVTENFLDTVPRYLMMGKSANPGTVGALHFSFFSGSAGNPDEFKTDLIKGVRIILRPV